MDKRMQPALMIRKRLPVLSAIVGIFLCFAVSGCLRAEDHLSKKERSWLNSHTGRIVVGGEPQWPPVSFYDKKGRFSGIAADYIRLLEKKLGCRFTVKKMKSWSDTLEAAEASKIDIVMNIAPTRDRAEFLRFTQPYMEIPTAVITRKDMSKPLTPAMMDGMEVAVTEEYQVCDYLEQTNPDIRLVHVDTSVNAVKRLSEGEFDAFVSEVASTSYIIEKEGITNLHIAGFTGHEYNLTIGCTKDHPFLAGILEKGLSMISMEERERIKKKWISLEQGKTQEESEKHLWILLAAGSLLAVLSVYAASLKFTGKKGKSYPVPLFAPWLKAALVIFFAAAAVCLFIVFNPDGFQSDSLTPAERNWLDAHDGRIRFAVDEDYPPFDFYDERNLYTGLSADFIRLIEEKLHFRFKKVRLKNWEKIMAEARAGTIDVIPSIQKTTARSDFLMFTEPYVTVKSVIITRKGTRQHLRLDHMEDMKVAVVKNYAVVNFLKKNHPQIELIPFNEPFSGLTSVAFNQTDAMVLDLPVASYYIQKEGIANLKVAGTAGYTENLRLASKKELPMLNRILEKGLSTISAREKRQILSRWLYLEQPPFYETARFWRIMILPALLILGVFLAVLFWNRALHIRVVERTLALDRELAERKKAEKELQQALARVKTLKGLVPICSSCKKIRDDQGFWNQIEQYIEKHSDAMFSHGICPECTEKLYGEEDWYKKMKKKNQLP